MKNYCFGARGKNIISLKILTRPQSLEAMGIPFTNRPVLKLARKMDKHFKLHNIELLHYLVM